MKILLASHGRLASGMKTSLEILIGSDAEKVTVIDAYIDNVNIDTELENYFKSINESDQVLMLSDLYGGSVNQKMYLYLERKNTFLVAGVNLAFVLEVCMLDEITIDVLNKLIEQSRQMERIVMFDKSEIAEDEDFL